MPDKLMIVMVNTNPRDPAALSAPFSQATVAAAMEFEVEMIFSGGAGEILKPGLAERLRVSENSDRTIQDLIREAHEAGVKFKVCTSVIERWGDGLIDQVDETVGSAYLISEAMDSETVVFTY